MTRVLAETASWAIMLGISAFLLTPYGLMATPFILAGWASLWLSWRTCRRIRNRFIIWQLEQTPKGRAQLAAIDKILRDCDAQRGQPQ